MRIAVIGPPWVPVPPPAYGGTEAVLEGLLVGLAAKGHDVAYAGHPESSVDVPLLPGVDPDDLGPIGDTPSELTHVLLAAEAADAWGADVIHAHTLLAPLVAPAGVPMVVTNHGPFDAMLTPCFERFGRRCAVVAISHAQASAAPSVPIAGVVHHGIDVDTWPWGEGSGGYVLFLGRMNADKGPHRAIELARQAGVPIVLAAKMREQAEFAFFEEHVRPLLGRDARFVGEADATTKRELLAGATALLNPIQWSEPFGMVMVEALACGTPVITAPLGAAPEIVEHGVTGFLCRTAAAMVSAIESAPRLDRRVCRKSVAARFTIDRMVAGYVSLYRRVTVGIRNAFLAAAGG